MKKLKHAVISSFLSKTKDRFHEYNRLLTLEEKLDFVAGLENIDGIEAVFPYEVNDAEKLKKELQKRNLHLSALNVNIKVEPEFRDGGLTNPSKEIRDKAVQFIKDGKDFAQKCGADKVTCCPLGDGYEFNFQSNYVQTWEYLKETIGAAAAYKPEIPLFIEYKPSETRATCFLDSAAKTVSLFNAIGASSLGVTLDFGHSIYGGENPAEALALVHNSGYPVYIHTNDNNGRWDWDLVAGSNHFVQFAEFIYYLQVLGYDDYITTDTSPTRWDIKDTFEMGARITDELWKRVDGWDKSYINSLLTGTHYMEIAKYLESGLYKF